MAKAEKLDKVIEEENCFFEGDVITGKVFTTFNFSSEPASPAPESSAAPASSKTFKFNNQKPTADALTDNRRTKNEANTSTPPIEGEAYTVARYYKLRYSTAKMLNEIKASHHNVNVYMNTLVDEAIRYYYSFGFKKGN